MISVNLHPEICLTFELDWMRICWLSLGNVLVNVLSINVAAVFGTMVRVGYGAGVCLGALER